MRLCGDREFGRCSKSGSVRFRIRLGVAFPSHDRRKKDPRTATFIFPFPITKTPQKVCYIFFFDDPDFVRDLFEFVLVLALRFGRAQAEAGADIIGIGDPAASLVGPRIYEETVWPYQKKLVDGLHATGVRLRLHICGDTRRMLEGMGRLGCEIIDIDSKVPISEARSRMGPAQVLLGGIDPVRVLQNGTPAQVAAAVADCHNQAGPRYIIGAGCEVPPDTPAENLFELLRYAESTTV